MSADGKVQSHYHCPAPGHCTEIAGQKCNVVKHVSRFSRPTKPREDKKQRPTATVCKKVECPECGSFYQSKHLQKHIKDKHMKAQVSNPAVIMFTAP